METKHKNSKKSDALKGQMKGDCSPRPVEGEGGRRLGKGVFHGFTLIELLIVVLIIAILAAVALPQYRIAVGKARAMQAIIWVKQVAEAERLYYLTYGTYATKFSQLDIEMPAGGTSRNASSISYPGYTCDLLIGHYTGETGIRCNVSGYGVQIQFDFYQTPQIRQKLWNESFWCLSRKTSTLGNQVCKSLSASEGKTWPFWSEMRAYTLH